jgi:hypothetical protein
LLGVVFFKKSLSLGVFELTSSLKKNELAMGVGVSAGGLRHVEDKPGE